MIMRIILIAVCLTLRLSAVDEGLSAVMMSIKIVSEAESVIRRIHAAESAIRK